MAISHVSDELLLDYVAGGLGEATGLLVASHLTLCPRCRKIAGDLDSLGGVLLEALPGTPVDGAALDRLLAAVEAPPGRPAASEGPSADPPGALLPGPLREHVGDGLDGLRWRRLLPGLELHALSVEDRSAKARLVRVAPGRPMPAHGHRGSELTLVLQGSFADENGRYARGDVAFADGGVIHRPVAGPGEACVCLLVIDAPLKLAGPLGWIVNPFLRL